MSNITFEDNSSQLRPSLGSKAATAKTEPEKSLFSSNFNSKKASSTSTAVTVSPIRKKQARFTDKFSKITSLIKEEKDSLLIRLNEYLESCDNINSCDADALIYGISLEKIVKNGVISRYNCTVSNNNILQIVFYGQNEKMISVKISHISEISFGKNRGKFMKFRDIAGLDERKCLTIHLPKFNTLDLIFEKVEDMINFVFGIKYLLEYDTIDKDSNESQIRKIWNMYDKDHSNKLDINEFKKFVREAAIKEGSLSLNNENTIVQLFNRIDKDKSGTIDYNEFFEYYQELISGKDIDPIFKQYSKGKEQMTVFDLIEFMRAEQNEDFRYEDAVQLVIDYNQKISETIKTSVRAVLE